MRELPLTVLAYEGSSARAYLAMMRRAGWRPHRIIQIIQELHPATGKPVGRYLPRRLRMWYAQKTQELANNYWPRRIKQQNPNLVQAIADRLEIVVPEAGDIITEITGTFDYENYADRVDRVLVRNLRDKRLAGYIQALTTGAVLFTGGGLLATSVLEIPGIKVLHVHPGRLPFVRGADGLLWSTLVRGKPGMSCFYMAPGIDEGDVIVAEDLPNLCFPLESTTRPDDQTLYRAVFSYYDPILRAEFFLRNIVKRGTDLCTLPAVEQDVSEGITYHFMHSSLRRKALERLFPAPGKERAPADEVNANNNELAVAV